MTDKNEFWNRAGLTGLLLGAIPVLYTAAVFFLKKPLGAGFSGTALSFLAEAVLWLAKTIGCALVLYRSMKRFAAVSGNGGTFRFGAAASVLSALIFSALYFAYTLYLVPGEFNAELTGILDKMSPSMDINTREQMEAAIPEMPRIMFFANFFYCSLYGCALSSILSRLIKTEQ